MNEPVVVGVDGSSASIRAAVWAADEAISRDTALELLYVIDPAAGRGAEDAMVDAHRAIHRAWETVSQRVDRVKLESAIVHGDPARELAKAAGKAAMICVGHKGADDSAPRPRGATAATLIDLAPGPVAVVRRRHLHPPTFHRWVVAILDESAESRKVLSMALDEAIMRDAPMLALTTWSSMRPEEPAAKAPNLRSKLKQYMKEREDDSADVQLCVLPLPPDLTLMLEESASIDQLFVVGASRRRDVDGLLNARARKALRGTNCSILVVREKEPQRTH
jgi:nucleotide-binding universal stress UspA family protein